MFRHHGTEVLQTHVFVRRWIVYVRYAVHTLSSEQYDDDDIGHRRTLLPLWGNSPVVPEPLQGDTRSLSGGLRGFDGARRVRPVKSHQMKVLARQRPHWQTMGTRRE